MSICLCLIAKNDLGNDESHVLPRLLESCRGHVSWVAALLTSQTGAHGDCGHALASAGIPYTWDSFNWEGDFAAARNRALELVPPSADWVLLLDCDEVLEHGEMLGELVEHAPSDALVLPFLLNGQLITRVNLIRNLGCWAYSGAIHETLVRTDGQEFHALLMGNPDHPEQGPHVTTRSDGARSRDPLKADHDMEALADDLANTRSLFYYALMAMQRGWAERAEEKFSDFLLRPDAHPSMRYCAALYRARLNEGYTAREAMRLNPSRPEAWGDLATRACVQEDWPMARAYTLAALHNPAPSDLAFLEPHWLRWRLKDILSVALINMGWREEAKPILRELLGVPDLPEQDRVRILEHLKNIS